LRIAATRKDAGKSFLDRLGRREAAGEHATQFATISSENKAAVYEHFFFEGIEEVSILSD
jgi:hypothetical protein